MQYLYMHTCMYVYFKSYYLRCFLTESFRRFMYICFCALTTDSYMSLGDRSCSPRYSQRSGFCMQFLGMGVLQGLRSLYGTVQRTCQRAPKCSRLFDESGFPAHPLLSRSVVAGCWRHHSCRVCVFANLIW